MIFLIDFENVSDNALAGIENLDNSNRLIVFYSQQAGKISINTHLLLEKSDVIKEYIPVKSGGKNALDFQLSTYLGYLVQQNKDEHFVIVSKDTGFDYVCSFWKERNIKIQRAVNVKLEKSQKSKQTTQPKPTTPPKQTPQPNTISPELKSCLKNANVDIQKVASIINKYKTKQGINNALVKEFGSTKTGEIYKEIKSFLKEKK